MAQYAHARHKSDAEYAPYTSRQEESSPNEDNPLIKELSHIKNNLYH